MIRTLSGDPAHAKNHPPEQALDLLEEQARALQRWRPGGIALGDAVRQLSVIDIDARESSPQWSEQRRLFEIARASLAPPHTWPEGPTDPADIWHSLVSRAWLDQAVVIRRYLAAHAFASWIAYQGSGLLSIIRRLRTALAVLRIEVIRSCAVEGAPLTQSGLKHSIRQADLLLVHLVDRNRLATHLRG